MDFVENMFDVLICGNKVSEMRVAQFVPAKQKAKMGNLFIKTFEKVVCVFLVMGNGMG